ncbi:MAG: bifunctional enoyl-CoA hydratase/phosphate acetyltransferase [Alcaligenaceae bacterium]|nr:bifunctional enoyl-CoA hydratase/phosphate acetyltransferase [Alcaligenaceae bacterium]
MRLVNRTFEELQIGDKAELRRLITEDDLYVFAQTSGNYNPLSLPNQDVDGDGEPENMAPTMFVASIVSAVVGNILPGPGAQFKDFQFESHGRAHPGEEMLIEVEVIEKKENNIVSINLSVKRSSDNELVLDGKADVIAPTVKYERDKLEVPGLLVQRHRHFEELLQRAKQCDPIPVAVVCPHNTTSLGGAVLAAKEGIIIPILLGNKEKILEAAKQMDTDISNMEIIEVEGKDQDVALEACKLVHEGRAVSIMKGHLHTDDLLRAMLNKEHGLRVGRRFTHVFVMDAPSRPELLYVSDAAINIYPDLATKVDITQNAIDLAVSLGVEARVAVLSAVEVVNANIQSSVDAALLSKMADRGQIRGGLVEGPLAMDNAIDENAARTKGIVSEVAGRANVLIMPDLDAANMFFKQMTYVAYAEGAGLVLGSKVPVILNSRSDSEMSRLASCAVVSLQYANRKNK